MSTGADATALLPTGCACLTVFHYMTCPYADSDHPALHEMVLLMLVLHDAGSSACEAQHKVCGLLREGCFCAGP